jgi:C_GCAxxG_C_C family probable redox protein
MWEAYGLGNEDFLWAGTALHGGVGGHRKAACGAVSASALCLGLRHRRPLDGSEEVEEAKDAASNKAKRLAGSFERRFGSVICDQLVDFSTGGPGTEAFRENAEKKCIPYIMFAIEKLYRLDKK